MPFIERPKKKVRIQQPYKHERKSAPYYNTKQWVNLRDWYIKRNPLCECCLEQGKVTPATEVHHVQPFLQGITDEERWALLTDEDNLMSVCNKCHKELHNQLKKNT